MSVAIAYCLNYKSSCKVMKLTRTERQQNAILQSFIIFIGPHSWKGCCPSSKLVPSLCRYSGSGPSKRNSTANSSAEVRGKLPKHEGPLLSQQVKIVSFLNHTIFCFEPPILTHKLAER